VSGTRPLRLVLASANPDKVGEIVAVLGQALAVELVPRPTDVPDVVEDADTLAGNARLKAQALVAATGVAAVAAAVVVAFGAWPRLWPRAGTGLLQGGLIWYAPVSAFSSGDNPAYVEYHWRGLQEVAGNLYVIAGSALFVLALAAAAYTLRARRSGQPQRSRT